MMSHEETTSGRIPNCRNRGPATGPKLRIGGADGVAALQPESDSVVTCEETGSIGLPVSFNVLRSDRASTSFWTHAMTSKHAAKGTAGRVDPLMLK
jgi:hypothetical protein